MMKRKKIARMSLVKQAAQDMTNEEKKQARKAFDDDVNDEVKPKNQKLLWMKKMMK